MRCKKILAVLTIVAVSAVSAAMFAAVEAHVINVTAHIENALEVDTNEIAFGTVFPQEYTTEQFTLGMSRSFLDEGRVDDIKYEIKQKPKPILPQTDACVDSAGKEFENVDEARAYCHDNPDDLDCCYLSLCPYLSKMDGDPEDNNDTDHPSYYVPESTDAAGVVTPAHCQNVVENATGFLAKSAGDLTDAWIVDLKVPPVEDYVGQDWPEGCPTVEKNDRDYGCDLWVEVTEISESVAGILATCCIYNSPEDCVRISKESCGDPMGYIVPQNSCFPNPCK